MRCTLVAAVAVLASFSADGRDALVGVWRGSQGPYRHEITIARRGSGYLASGLIYGHMTLAEAHAISRGARPRLLLDAVRVNKPFCNQKYYVMRKDGETYRATCQKVVRIRSPDAPTKQDLTLTLDPDGYLYGAVDSEHDYEKHIWLRRVEPPAKRKSFDIAKGATASVTCFSTPEFHFKVRVPDTFDPAVPTPVLVYFSPVGDANPMEPETANDLGWVSVGLTEAKNGPVAPIFNNREAVLFHLAAHMHIHPRRIYFSGMSGGSRSAHGSSIQRLDTCAGVIGLGAGVSGSMGLVFWEKPTFHIVGKTDMNNSEVKRLYGFLMEHGMQTELIVHPGGHTTGRAEDRIRAMRWMEHEWFSGTDPLEKSDLPRLEELATSLAERAEDADAPGRREACYWLWRMSVNRRKELPGTVTKRIRSLARDPVYRREAMAGAAFKRLFGKSGGSGALRAIATRYPGTTIAGRIAAMRQ